MLCVSQISSHGVYPSMVSADIINVDGSWKNITCYLKAAFPSIIFYLKVVWFLEGLPEFNLEILMSTLC